MTRIEQIKIDRVKLFRQWRFLAKMNPKKYRLRTGGVFSQMRLEERTRKGWQRLDHFNEGFRDGAFYEVNCGNIKKIAD